MKFRGAIYVDIEIEDVETGQHDLAKQKLTTYALEVPNAYAGGVAEMRDGDLLGNLERLRGI